MSLRKDQQIAMMQFIEQLPRSNHPDGKYTYGEIAAMNKPFIPGGAQAVGTRLGAICRNHLDAKKSSHQNCCFKVVNQTTRQHNCQSFSSER